MISSAGYPDTPDYVSDDEAVLRHLIHKKWVKNSGQYPILAPEAVEPFMLKTEDGTQRHVLGFSVSRKLSLSMEQIYLLGEDVVKVRNQKEPDRFSYLGYATFMAHEIRALGLDLVKSEPPPHHADVVGWPSPVPLKASEQIEVNNLKLALVRLAVIHLR